MKNTVKKTILLAAACCLLSSLSAQEIRKYEIGAETSYGIGLGKVKTNQYGFDLYGGFKVNDRLSTGAGLDYVNYPSRLLPSGIERVVVQTEAYHAFRPFVYARYDFLPNRKWTPFAAARAGYAFFGASQLSFGVLYGYEFGGDGTVNAGDYEYLRDLDHTLKVKGGVFGSIDLGMARRIGSKGGKISIGLSLEYQPVMFTYYKHVEKRTNLTIGPKIGLSF
ncbi:MAG: hypothetical protein IJ156_06375 [Bacteroidales bacterium]|nr:hypothetical protein [Bacteroidales bacterium]